MMAATAGTATIQASGTIELSPSREHISPGRSGNNSETLTKHQQKNPQAQSRPFSSNPNINMRHNRLGLNNFMRQASNPHEQYGHHENKQNVSSNKNVYSKTFLLSAKSSKRMLNDLERGLHDFNEARSKA